MWSLKEVKCTESQPVVMSVPFCNPMAIDHAILQGHGVVVALSLLHRSSKPRNYKALIN